MDPQWLDPMMGFELTDSSTGYGVPLMAVKPGASLDMGGIRQFAANPSST